MTKKRIAILTCLLLLGVVVCYFISNYLNERATQSYEWTSNPIVVWVMAIPVILLMITLVILGILIGRKYETN
jgi:uncharacterized membrane protein YdfJ with MMPL/SSD domain